MQVPQLNQSTFAIQSKQFSSKSSDNGETIIHFLNSDHHESNIFEEELDFQFKLMDEENKNRQQWAYDHSLSEISQLDCLQKIEEFKELDKNVGEQNLNSKQDEKSQKDLECFLNIGVYIQEEHSDQKFNNQFSFSKQLKPKNHQLHHSKRKNASKNIIKNFGRDLLNYIIECKAHQSKHKSQGLFPDEYSSLENFRSISKIEKIKKQINGISHLKQLWTDEKEGILFRKISQNYLRKRAFKYIFGSRVKAYKEHLEFKEILRKNLRRPQNFTHLITKYF